MAMKKKEPSANNGGKQTKGPGEGLIYMITTHVLWLFLANFYFLLMNLPLLYVLLAGAASGDHAMTSELSIPLMLASLPAGPAATALLSVMGKLIRDRDLNVTRDFFKAYKVSFIQSLLLWAICLAALNFMSFDATLAAAHSLPRVIVVGIYFLMIYVCDLMVFALAIVSRFHLKLKDVIRYAIFYSIRKPHVAIVNLFCLGFVVILSVKVLSFLMLFVFSIIALGIMSNLRNTLVEIEDSLMPDGE